MTYLLDTDICIYIRRMKPQTVYRRFMALVPGEMGMSVVTWGELQLGAYKSQLVKHNLDIFERLSNLIPVLSLPEQAGTIYGRIRAKLEQAGTPIGANDLWIAAHAMAAGLTLVSNNTREFRRIKGLKVENWI